MQAVYPVARQKLAIHLAYADVLLYVVFVAFELAFLLWFYSSGLSVRLRNYIEHSTRWPFMCAAVFIVITYVALSLMMLPLTYYASFVLPHQYGLSAETPARWLRDWAVALIFSAVVLSAVGATFLRIVARVRAWPAIAAVGAAALLIFGGAIYPVFVTPLFNTFRPLGPSPLNNAILALARQQGLNAGVVYEYNMSLQTREANAYVAGLGKTERIAVGDTLLHSMKPDEVLFVMAHEIGHYKLGHLWLGTFEAWLGSIVLIVILATLGKRLASANPARSRDLSDPAALPLIAALFLVCEIVALPISNGLSRQIEHAADMFAIQHTHLGGAGVRAQARLASQDLAPLHPSRFVVWLFYTHPPSDERIMDAARGAGLVP